MTRVPREAIINFVQGRCSPEEGLKILEQIEASPESSRDLDLFSDILGVFHDNPDLSAETGPWRTERRRIHGPGSLRDRLSSASVRYALPAAIVAVVVIVIVLGYMPRFGQDRPTLLEADLSMVEWATRGVTGSDVEAAREAAFRGELSTARKHILRYVNTAHADPERACGLITAGALSLLEAREKSGGWWRRNPDPELLRIGVGYLEEAARLRVPPNVRNEARLVLARGLYWLDRKAEAVSQLDSVSGADPLDRRRADALRSMIATGQEGTAR
jgi:hypothetical protein